MIRTSEWEIMTVLFECPDLCTSEILERVPKTPSSLWIYATLYIMKNKGLLKSKKEPTKGARERQIYRLTSKGFKLMELYNQRSNHDERITKRNLRSTQKRE